MTSPDAFNPPRSVGIGTVSALQDVTQESVAAQQSADVQNMLGEVADTFFDNLLGGFGGVIQAIGAGINQFIRDLVYALKGITGGFIDLTGFFQDQQTGIDNANTTANNAQTTANNAHSVATGLSGQVSAAQAAATDAANVAAVAADLADQAIVGATWREKEFALSTAGTFNGRNEAPAGILMPTPPGYIQRVERVIYRSDTNVGGTCNVQLIRKTSGGVTTVIVTTAIPLNATLVPDSSPSYALADLDSLYCNVTDMSGTITGMTCTVETALVASP